MHLLRHFSNLNDQWLLTGGILIITQISKRKEVPLQESLETSSHKSGNVKELVYQMDKEIFKWLY